MPLITFYIEIQECAMFMITGNYTIMLNLVPTRLALYCQPLRMFFCITVSEPVMLKRYFHFLSSVHWFIEKYIRPLIVTKFLGFPNNYKIFCTSIYISFTIPFGSQVPSVSLVGACCQSKQPQLESLRLIVQKLQVSYEEISYYTSTKKTHHLSPTLNDMSLRQKN